VFGVPGPVNSAASAGTNQLIRQGAILVRGVEDILEEFDGVKATAPPVRAAAPPHDLDETQRRAWEFLGDQSRHMDDITRHLGLTVSEVSRTLMQLEMKKVIRRLPGNQYERC
jgi:DNA processing protein